MAAIFTAGFRRLTVRAKASAGVGGKLALVIVPLVCAYGVRHEATLTAQAPSTRAVIGPEQPADGQRARSSRRVAS